MDVKRNLFLHAEFPDSNVSAIRGILHQIATQEPLDCFPVHQEAQGSVQPPWMYLYPSAKPKFTRIRRGAVWRVNVSFTSRREVRK